MIYKDLIGDVKSTISEKGDEVYIKIDGSDFGRVCLLLHKKLRSPIMSYFAADERKNAGVFKIYCLFLGIEYKKWFFVVMDLPGDKPSFGSLSKEIHSANLFEREIKEMFGIEAVGSPDSRRLRLHDEIWPDGAYPLRKDFNAETIAAKEGKKYEFKKVEGEGVFEVPVGPVHAGIIGPGHFRFSVAGEPVINLETRFGFTHRGIEKILEEKDLEEALKITECVCGDSVFGHSLAFCQAVEKIYGIEVPVNIRYLRAAFLELERMYNHVNDIGGMALDVSYTFPSAYASLIKESLLALNKRLTGHRYLKGVNAIGGLKKRFAKNERFVLHDSLESILKDFNELKKILLSGISFMDRVDSTGILRKNTAEDLGVIGLAGRASGVNMDLRKHLPSVYDDLKFDLIKQAKGDVLARLTVRFDEFAESVKIIRQCMEKIGFENSSTQEVEFSAKEGVGLGYAEGWRGPILYWLKLNNAGVIERCKIVDPSFHNWQGLSYAVLGNIIPDFPLCNKSFDLSYSGNDL
ncbi:MAG: NADH-quinone oxidoreductase subunit C [Candidatus Omnitrophota bacterium]|nr:NADH-quinone oxidoreductase subunit C [Candidatus Omnitrophota bacterium]